MKTNGPLIFFECENLNYKFKDIEIFKNFFLSFSGPGIVQISGENGTGKSTLLKILSGNILAEKSKIHYCYNGVDFLPQNLKMKMVSYFPTTSLGLLSDLTGQEHVDFFLKALNLNFKDVEDEFKKFNEIPLVQEIMKKKSSEYSQGMRQILRLFLHLFFNPKIIFLDEPFLFLSPTIREYFFDKIMNLAKESLVFITDQDFCWRPTLKHIQVRL